MDSYENIGRIPKRALLGSSIALLAIATIATTARTVLRIHFHKHLAIDDGLLLFALLLAFVCIGLYVNFIDALYLLQASVEQKVPDGISQDEVNAATLRFHLYSDIFIMLSWTIVCAVKYSFLFFFRTLIRRIRAMEIYWWCVVGVTTIMWIAGCVGVFASCSYFDDRALSCATGTTTTTIVFYIVLALLDIGTDLAIIAIPVSILRKVQIPLRTKLFLGLSLCLSAVIIVVVITQIAGLHDPATGKVDVVWEIYWQFIEPCVAIIVVCVAAFRSFFVQHRSRNQSPPRSPWYQGVKNLWTTKTSALSTEDSELPPVPGATLSGMRTFIEGNGRDQTHNVHGALEQDDDRWPLHSPVTAQRIKVQHEVSTHWENSSREHQMEADRGFV